MPDSIESCGELIAPPARMTSRLAFAILVWPFCDVLDAGRARSFHRHAW